MSEENKNLGEEAKDAAKKAAKKASEKASELKEDAKEVFEDVKDDAKEFAEDAKETAKDFKEGAKEAFDNLSKAGGENKKILAGILAIVLGSLGVHKFILGYQKEGLILLGVSVVGYATLCLAIGAFILMVTGIIGLIEGIIYLTKSDEEFYQTYQVNKKPWF
ncbi:MAG: TM2 domain-containing protein [Aureibaculum sp.]|nr:TM2 domain-containing protein [Aureibaculum sp.]